MSVPEKIMWKWIRNEQLGYKFRRQYSIGKYIADFYCSELRLVLEIDGSIHGEEIVALKDGERDAFMKNIGLVIKRYTAKDVNDNLEWLLGDVKQTCVLLASAAAKDGKPLPSSP